MPAFAETVEAARCQAGGGKGGTHQGVGDQQAARAGSAESALA